MNFTIFFLKLSSSHLPKIITVLGFSFFQFFTVYLPPFLQGNGLKALLMINYISDREVGVCLMVTILIYWWWNVLVRWLTTESAASDHHKSLDTSRVRFELAQNRSFGFVEWICFVGWPTKVHRSYLQQVP